MSRAILAAASLALIAPQVAAAAEPVCLTNHEASAIAAYALPSVITGTTQRCAPVLGSQSWIARNGDDLAKRYADRKVVVWPETKAALLKMSLSATDPASQALRALPDASIMQLADGLVAAAVAEKLPTSRCGAVDHFLALIAPLPPENMADLIAMSLGILAQGEHARLGKLPICKV
jgi:hypothetical protein